MTEPTTLTVDPAAAELADELAQFGEDEPRSTDVEHVTQAGAHPALMVNRDHLDLIRTTLNPDLTDGELTLFAQVANRVGLDPFARQIYATKRGGKMVIQTGIDGYRLIARRTGEMSGRLGPYFAADDGKGWRIGQDGKPLPWLSQEPPAAAMVGVVRRGDAEVTWGMATWAEYAITGTGDAMWRKMPSTMLAKCAEAQAIRATFPAETSGIYTEEEMAQAGNPDRPRAVTAGGGPSRSTPPGERLDPWNAPPREVVAELNRRKLPAAGAVPELRQRLADAMMGDVIDVTPTDETPQEAQDAENGSGPQPSAEAPGAQETPQEAPVVVEYCAAPDCDADLDETGAVHTQDDDNNPVAYCPDHAPV
jgi:phage recombination protein Bet